MSVQDLGISLDTVWMLLAAMLVFFMQPGFALCEAGFTRSKTPRTSCSRTSSTSWSVRFSSGS